ECTTVDSRLHRYPLREAESPQALQARAPVSARGRLERHLCSSQANPLQTTNGRSGVARDAAAPPPPVTPRGQAVFLGGKGVLHAPEDSAGNDRRRLDRSYSDLFGNASGRPSPRGVLSRSELHGTASASWIDSATETSARVSRNAERRSPRGIDYVELDAGTLIYNPRSKPVVPVRSEEEIRKGTQERACWDVLPQGGMQTAVEIARRRRENRINAMARSTGSLAEPKTLSACERKRANLASGQLRTGTGAPLEPHDDGRASAWTVPGARRSAVSPVPSPSARHRSISDSPSLVNVRGIPPHSARGRKIKDMMTSEGIF
ncbi:unnamed protein product, partial [Polarella glacialis]